FVLRASVNAQTLATPGEQRAVELAALSYLLEQKGFKEDLAAYRLDPRLMPPGAARGTWEIAWGQAAKVASVAVPASHDVSHVVVLSRMLGIAAVADPRACAVPCREAKYETGRLFMSPVVVRADSAQIIVMKRLDGKD